MRWVLLFIAALLIAAGIASFSPESGHVLINTGGWNIQMSLALFLTAAAIIFVLAYVFTRLLIHLWEMPAMLRRWRSRRQQQLAEDCLTQGLLALVEGRWQAAEAALIKGVRYTSSPLINYLCAARAAQRQGHIDQRDQYLRLAHSADPGAEMAIGLTQAELQIQQQQTELALATLTHLHEQQPRQKQVRLLLFKTRAGLQDWKEALRLLPELERERLLPAEEIHAARLQACAGLLQQAGNSASKARLHDAWWSIPKKLRSEAALIEEYTREKMRFADTADCEPLLRQALKKRWDAGIVRLYGMVEGKDLARQLAFAESFLASHPRDPVLQLTLGRLCLRHALWGKAAAYLKECIQIQPLPEAYNELARLLEKQGDYSGASSYYQQGLTLATSVARHDSVKLLEQAQAEEAITAGARQVV